MPRLLLVGCGKMGAAMLDGWLSEGLSPKDIVVVDPSGTVPVPEVTIIPSADKVPDGFLPDVVVLAVKPQVMDEVAPPYGRFTGAVFLSIAAGKTLASFGRLLGGDAAVVRAMPNTPAAVRRGMTVMVANAQVSEAQKRLCNQVIQATGELAWIGDESQMDAVTAVSGSGPAYVFLMVEALAAAGVRAGLPEALAVQLARATVAGAGELVRQSDQPAGTLRQNVTSPGGTTAAALAVLMAEGRGLPSLMDEAVAAAARRSRELAG